MATIMFGLHKADGKCIYQQIYKEIKDRILDGVLQPNEKLPSKRKLASQLGVSVNSVTNAYEQLLAEGYIYTMERKGYYVERITPFVTEDKSRLYDLPTDLKEAEVTKEGWLSLSHMTSDVSSFPFTEWLKCQDRAIKNHLDELSEIPHPQGPYLVRKTIANLIESSRGIICEPEQIVIGAGTQSLISNLMNIPRANNAVAIEDPGYSRFYRMLKNMGMDVHPIPLDEDGIDIHKVESSKSDIVFVTPSHQFPTGKIMPISRRIELLNWAVKSDHRYIIEDDYDSEFKYKTDNIPSLQSLDRNRRVIYTGTFSKTMLPGLRISYMVLPPDLLRLYRGLYSDLIQGSNTLSLYTLHYFIESGDYARHIKKMNHLYESKRTVLINHLLQRFGNQVVVEDTSAGLHFLVRFHTDKRYQTIEQQARWEKLEIYTMKRFMLSKTATKKGCIELILGFANITEENIPEAVERLYGIIN